MVCRIPSLSFVGSLPWTYFATALNRCIMSVVADAHVISKIYFPRLLLPISGTISGVVDFSISLVLLLGLMSLVLD